MTALTKVMERNAINEHIEMVQDCRDKLNLLAEELNATDHYTSFSIEQERDSDEIDYRCNIRCTFGASMNYHAGSYVSKTHPFEEAEKSIRNAHAEWKEQEDKRQRTREEERIKRALYEDYLAQKSDKA